MIGLRVTNGTAARLDDFGGGASTCAGSAPTPTPQPTPTQTPTPTPVGMGASKVLAKRAVIAPQQQGGGTNVCAKYGIVATDCMATSYYAMGGQRVAMRVQRDVNTTGTVYWLHGDHLGSASLTTDESGKKVAEVRFKPWGEVRWSSGVMPTDRQFEGMTTHAALGGLVTMGAREYSPMLGRWLSADTIVPRPEDSQAFNRYSYVRNSPLTRTDPSGHCDGQSGGVSCGSVDYYGVDESTTIWWYTSEIQGMAKELRESIRNGTLGEVEGLARLVDRAWFRSGHSMERMLQFLAPVLVGLDPKSVDPAVWLLSGKKEGEYYVPGLMRYDSSDPNTAKRGDLAPDYYDGTSHQARHFWFYVVAAFYDPELLVRLGNVLHDPAGYLGFKCESGPCEDSKEDFDLGKVGITLGRTLYDQRNNKNLDPGYLVRLVLTTSWIR